MPTAPMLPPDEMAKAQATAGINPINFLTAAATMHNEGSLSAPTGPKTDPLAATKSKKPFQKKIRIIK
jgi:hypothetical protein